MKLDMKKFLNILYLGGLICSFITIIVSVNLLMNKRCYGESVIFEGKKFDITSTDFSNVKDDIGLVISDTIVTCHCIMHNNGERNLRVLFVSPDCNCTEYRLSKNIAVPGDSIILSLVMDMRKKHKGKFMLNTVVGLNTRQRLHRISIEGEVFDKTL